MAIKDFGEKIGGAKKDLWKERNMLLDDLLDMNEAERDHFIKKDNVWKKPDYQELVDNGIPVRVVYFMKKIRDATPVKPVFTYRDDTPELRAEKQEGYISFVSSLRDVVMAMRTEDDVLSFYNDYLAAKYITRRPGSYYVDILPEAYDCISNKLLKAAQVSNFRSIDRDIKDKQFCYSADAKLKADEAGFMSTFRICEYDTEKVTFDQDYSGRCQVSVAYSMGRIYFYPQGEDADPGSWQENKFFIIRDGHIIAKNIETEEEAKDILHQMFEKLHDKSLENKATGAKKRKTSFTPKQLQHIQRNGPNHREGFPATGEDYLEVFGFKGGEFGNWLNEKDRRASLNYGFDALMDLCEALRIAPEDVSLGGRLSIAFGSRGSGNALAHYEPMREVINLTKMKGAGSLAHEWAHALDDIFGKDLGANGFMTQRSRRTGVPEAVTELVDAMQYKEVSNEILTKTQQENLERKKEYVRNNIESYFPLKSMTDEQKEKLDSLIGNYMEMAKKPDAEILSCFLDGNGNAAIDALSDFRKEVSGRIIPKESRIDLAHHQYSVQTAMLRVGEPEKVKTDFYKNSIAFDNVHSKTDHGYWQSNIEMFARAFACYVNDKLAEQGLKSDYLCGHSEMAVSFATNKRTGELELIAAIPQDDERKIINRCFDKLITQLKEKGLLHDYVPEHESTKDKKTSLDDLIKASSTQQSWANETRGIVPKFVEEKDGQLGFDL